MHRKPSRIFAHLNIDVQGSQSKGARKKVQGARCNLVAKVWILEHEGDQLLLLQAFYLGRTLLCLQNKLKTHIIFEFMKVDDICALKVHCFNFLSGSQIGHFREAQANLAR